MLLLGQDICVGDFWVTDERSRIAPFSSDIAVDFLLLFKKVGFATQFAARLCAAREISVAGVTESLGLGRNIAPLLWLKIICLLRCMERDGKLGVKAL
jgi:hypothetical protein